jgi:hypothetical protein
MTAPAETGYWTGAIIYTPSLGPAASLELGAVDSDGTCWVLADWDGMEGPPTSGGVVQRAGDHGAYAPPQYYAARPITLTIRAGAQTQALRDAARAKVGAAIPVSELALFRLDEPIPKVMWVRRSGQIMPNALTLVDIDLVVGLIAPDPRKYSATLNQQIAYQGAAAAGLAPPWTPPITLPAGAPPMSVSVTNAGSFETRPTVVIQGPVTAPRILNQVTGQTVNYTSLTLGSADQLAVDFLNRTALLNGAARPADANSSWWLLPPGTTGVQLLGTATTGASLTVLWRDAWI